MPKTVEVPVHLLEDLMLHDALQAELAEILRRGEPTPRNLERALVDTSAAGRTLQELYPPRPRT
ncbi:MAG: hypothetical protein KDD47_20240 [Acidobacteria bacterium]|nr:hypothetical protein [Acidobacteriota bacterium]